MIPQFITSSISKRMVEIHRSSAYSNDLIIPHRCKKFLYPFIHKTKITEKCENVKINLFISEKCVSLNIKSGKKNTAMHANTIKAEVKKKFSNVKVVEITKRSFGMFSVKVSEQRAKRTRIGFLIVETDFDRAENGCVVEDKINW